MTLDDLWGQTWFSEKFATVEILEKFIKDLVLNKKHIAEKDNFWNFKTTLCDL